MGTAKDATEMDCSRRSFLKGAAVAAIGTTGFALAGCSPTASKAISSSSSQVADGTYSGTAMGRAGDVTVEIVIKNSSIVGAEMIESAETATISTNAANGVIADVLKYQTLEVDTVSGATLTSMAVKNAIRSALEKAGGASAFKGAADYPELGTADCSTDVVIVGSGSAGMNAAAKLIDAGIDAILIEKQGFLGGGDTMFASSGLAGGGGYTVYKQGIVDSSEADYLALKKATAEKSGLPVDLENLAAYSLRSGDAVDYYISIGVPFGKYGNFSNTITNGSSPGTYIIKRLSEQMRQSTIDCRLNTKLVSLAKSGAAVTGIVVENESGQYTITANAVLLACGGFGNNEDMLAKYADAEAYCGLPHSGSVSAMGEGILAAEEIGAKLSNMTAIKANNICHITDNGAVISLAAIQSVAVLVDDNGNRFVNETGTTVHKKSDAELLLPNQEAWAIFDQTMIDEKKLIAGYNDLGYFETGATWDELAAKMGMDSSSTQTFVRTMEAWQATGAGNTEEAFGAKVNSVFDNPPYYAANVKPAMQSTYGGIETDASARVLDVSGNIIPGLYAAGAVSGHGCFGNAVGNGLAIASGFGIIAGETIAAELKA